MAVRRESFGAAGSEATVVRGWSGVVWCLWVKDVRDSGLSGVVWCPWVKGVRGPRLEWGRLVPVGQRRSRIH